MINIFKDVDKESESKDETIVEEKGKDKRLPLAMLSSTKYTICFR